MNQTTVIFHDIHQNARLSSKMVNDVLKPYGLYSAQWSILYTLLKFGEMTQTNIWRYLNVEAPTVTRTLVRLEKSGWVIRNRGNDKRERVVTLTAKSIKALPEVEKSVQLVEMQLLKGLTETEQDQLLTLLKKIDTKKIGGNGDE